MSLRTYFLRKKFWLNDFLHGSPMWKQYKEVRLIIENPHKGKSIIDRRLADILRYAKENTAFYSSVKGNTLADFPVINKQTILEDYSAFVIPTEKIPGQIGDVHIQKTSGSTGTPFQVYQDTNCRTRRIATIKMANDLIGFHSFDPMMHLRAIKHYWTFEGDFIWRADLCILYADNSNLTDERVKSYIDAINQYKIRFVRGYMTTLDTLTRYSVDHNYPLKTKPTFISVGELLLESLRLRIIKMGCQIISQYGNEENGIFGQSEINGSGSDITLYRANCIFEILKFDSDEPVGDNELGRIVITDFTNYAMPMIRYEIGDCAMIGRISSDGEILSIKNLIGRKTDMIFRTDGSPIDFHNSIPACIFNNSFVKQWQFIQKDKKVYELRLCINNDCVRDEEKHYVKLIKEILGDDAIINVYYPNEIPVLSSGKRKIVIQEYKKTII